MQKIIAAGGVVTNEDEDILLIFRRKHWDLPKGKLDENETIEQCAVREVKEEVGLQNVQLGAFICKTYHTYFDTWINEEVIKEIWWYKMQASKSEKLIPQTEEDIEKIIWADTTLLNDCLKNTYPSIVEVIKRL